LIGNYLIAQGQDSFANAIISLDTEFEFKQKTDSYKTSKKPDKGLMERFYKCAEFELSELKELDFEKIINVKSSELITTKWEGRKNQIEFQEWEFENEGYTDEFVGILDCMPHTHIQFCVNKGGIMWWKNKNKLYVVTSGAYFMTYHYKEIKETIKKAIN